MTVCSDRSDPNRRAGPDPVLVGVGANIAAHRRGRGVSQRRLAQQSGVDRAYLNGMEAGQRNPTVAVLARLAAALDTTVSTLTLGIGTGGGEKDSPAGPVGHPKLASNETKAGL